MSRLKLDLQAQGLIEAEKVAIAMSSQAILIIRCTQIRNIRTPSSISPLPSSRFRTGHFSVPASLHRGIICLQHSCL